MLTNIELADRLDELSDAVTKGDKAEFVMKIPARPDHCADLVLAEAAQRLREIPQTSNA